MRNSKPRDMQKTKLYAAERCPEHMRRWWTETPCRDTTGVWVFFERITKDPWFLRHYGRWTLWLRNGQGARIARGAYRGEDLFRRHVADLKLPRWARYRQMILHELAHAVASQIHGSGNIQGHGREYAAIYLDLVRHFLGAEAARQLRASFKAHGVKHRPKRVLSPEQLEVMRERGRQLAARRLSA